MPDSVDACPPDTLERVDNAGEESAFCRGYNEFPCDVDGREPAGDANGSIWVPNVSTPDC